MLEGSIEEMNDELDLEDKDLKRHKKQILETKKERNKDKWLVLNMISHVTVIVEFTCSTM